MAFDFIVLLALIGDIYNNIANFEMYADTMIPSMKLSVDLLKKGYDVKLEKCIVLVSFDHSKSFVVYSIV